MNFGKDGPRGPPVILAHTSGSEENWSALSYLLVGLAAIVGGAVNALAGGGTLITFPMLMAVGIPAVPANITNTVALCPGYLGGTFAQFRDLPRP